MVNVISSMYAFAQSIVSNAQPVWDGGIIDFMMNNVLFVNDSEKASPSDHMMETLTHGGYLAALVCGLIWAFLLLLVGVGLAVCYCRRRSDSKASVMYSILANRIQYKRQKLQRSTMCQLLQFILSIVFVLVAVVCCILAFVVNAHLNTAMSSTDDKNAVIPQVGMAVKNAQDYVEMLVPHAREATKPLVDGIIYKTALMQNETREAFSKALTKKIHGDILQEKGLELVNNFTICYNNMVLIRGSQRKLSRQNMEADFVQAYKRWQELCKLIEDFKTSDPGGKLLKECRTLLNQSQLRNESNINIDTEKIHFENAATLTNMLKELNQTPDSMRQQTMEALGKKKDMEDRMYIKSKRILKVSETIRNMTAKQWDDLELKLGPASESFDNISELIYGTAHEKAAGYEQMRNIVYLLVLFTMLAIGLMCAVVFTYNFCVPGSLTRRLRNAFKISLYVAMMLLGFVVVVCMGTFLLGGYSETEVCRYMEEEPTRSSNGSNMYLDKMVNKWLDEHWSEIESKMGNESSMPLPRPRDVFYGLKTACRANQSIMVAINAIDSMDTSKAGDPEMTKRFLRIGRELMRESLEDAKPSDLLRPNMAKEMVQLKMIVSQFIDKDYSMYINELSKRIIDVDLVFTIERLNSFRKKIKTLEAKATNDDRDKFDKAASAVSIVVNYCNDAKSKLPVFKEEIGKQKVAFVKLSKHKYINPIIDQMIPAIHVLASYVTNKTRWIAAADKLYDEVIVKSTWKKSPKLMEESTKSIMAVLGPCKHLYQAFQSATHASCTAVVHPLNLMWLFMGCCVFFLTPCIVIALLILTKEMTDPKPEFNGSGLSPSGDHVENVEMSQKPLKKISV